MGPGSIFGIMSAKRDRPAASESIPSTAATTAPANASPGADDSVADEKRARTGSSNSTPADPDTHKPEQIQISVIIPIYNAMPWLEKCFQSIAAQTFLAKRAGEVEVSVYNDASTDSSAAAIEKWKAEFGKRGVGFVASSSKDWASSKSQQGGVNDGIKGADAAAGAVEKPVGAGLGKNRAVKQSNGKWLCFIDADDEMTPNRLEKQFQRMQAHGPKVRGPSLHVQ